MTSAADTYRSTESAASHIPKAAEFDPTFPGGVEQTLFVIPMSQLCFEERKLHLAVVTQSHYSPLPPLQSA